MRIRALVLLVGALVLFGLACTETAPSLPTQDKGWLVLFKRVTVPADAPGLAEIELEVRTAAHLSTPSPDGTNVSVDTTFGQFEGGAKSTVVATSAGRTVLTLLLEKPSNTTLTARVSDAEASLIIDVGEDGAMKIGPS
jgi:hypothetical protein